MSETLIGLLIGVAAVIATYITGSRNQKMKQELKQAENEYEKSKLAAAIKAANDNIPDNDLRKWMQDNAKK